MSDDEVAVLAVSSFVALIRWGMWYYRAKRPPALLASPFARWPLLLIPPLCAVALWLILSEWSASDVRGIYVIFYMMIGAAWVGVGTLLLPVHGIFPAVDLIERRNPAVRLPIAGALLGMTLCFAGGNIGDGPGWWVVFFSAGLATLGWILLWALADLFTGITRSITVERDNAAGMRLFALLVGSGLILGRAVAGDWHSTLDTVIDFGELAWPAVGLLAVEAVFGIPGKPRPHNPHPSIILFGFMPVVVSLGGALAYIIALEWWT